MFYICQGTSIVNSECSRNPLEHDIVTYITLNIPACTVYVLVNIVGKFNRKVLRLTYGVQQLVTGVLGAVLLQDGGQPGVQVLLVVRHHAELLLAREQRDDVLLLEIQAPHDVVAALQRQHAPWRHPCAELLLRLIVLQPRGTLRRLRAQHEVLLLHRLQLPQLPLAHHGARAPASRRRHHSCIPVPHLTTLAHANR